MKFVARKLVRYFLRLENLLNRLLLEGRFILVHKIGSVSRVPTLISLHSERTSLNFLLYSTMDSVSAHEHFFNQLNIESFVDDEAKK